MESVRDDFAAEMSPCWNRHVTGGGSLQRSDGTLLFVNTNTQSDEYTNAQIDDYQGLRRSRFPWRPPTTLTVRARFSDPDGRLRGTAGFGFWNDPFMMTGRRVPTLPRAIWFFYASPPSDMKLDEEAPGCGWKAATIDASGPAALGLALVALPAALAMNAPSLYRLLWPPIQDVLNIDERVLDRPMTAWRTYRIEWGIQRSRFLVDGDLVLENAPSPPGPLGFVMWLDNQFMVVKPWGRFRWGFIETADRQWLEVTEVVIQAA